jgi:membrane-bound metal-dependent hydrolase YbcI (DUF457 family)
MPSPVGHALAGLAAAWTADLVPGDRAWRTAPSAAPWFDRAGDGLTIACVLLAMAPDLDLLFGVHRTITHSLVAIVFVALIAGAMAAGAARPVVRVALMCAAAFGTHILLDWLGADPVMPRGIQLFWPFSHRFYISDWDLFFRIERRQFLSVQTMFTNAVAMAGEVAVLAPLLILLWLIRVKALAGFSTQVARGDHPSK